MHSLILDSEHCNILAILIFITNLRLNLNPQLMEIFTTILSQELYISNYKIIFQQKNKHIKEWK